MCGCGNKVLEVVLVYINAIKCKYSQSRAGLTAQCSLTAGGVGGVHVTEYQSCYNQSLSSCENLNRQFESGGSQ